jgi:hypothetical protein
MADAKTTDEEELIPVETPPVKDDDAKPEAEAEGDDGEGEEDGEDDGDSRLAESEDDHDEDVATSTNRDRRKKRREMQKRAREAKERELELLRRQTNELQQRLAAVEGFAQQNTVRTIETQIAKAQSDVQQAELIIAKAVEAGNGEDVTLAMRIRDAAKSEFEKLSNTRQQYESQRQQPQVPQVDPTVAGYAKQWLQANPWYNPSGNDRDSALTKAIDGEIMAEGYDPKSREYWEELTNRVAEALGESEPARPKRRAPPTGNTREHAPVSTKKEIYVTPERKAAMMESGAWDDPVKRQRLLKAYAEFDRGSAR